jgi:hypothetical protein
MNKYVVEFTGYLKEGGNITVSANNSQEAIEKVKTECKLSTFDIITKVTVITKEL